MKKKALILTCCMLMLSVIMFGCDVVESEPLSLDVNVVATCEVGETVTPDIKHGGDGQLTVEVTAPNGEKVEFVDGHFIADKKGIYVIAVKVARGEELIEKSVKVDAKDLTAPQVTKSPSDKVLKKGNYDFTTDLAEVEATDNVTKKEQLSVKVTAILLDGKELEFDNMSNAYDFQKAGEYTIKFAVMDEDENKTEGQYKIVVNGMRGELLREVYDIGETIALPALEKFPSSAVINYELVKGEDVSVVENDFALIVAGEYTLKATLKLEEEVIDTLEMKFTVRDIIISLSEQFKEVYDFGEELTIPTFTASNSNANIALTLYNGEAHENVEGGQKVQLKHGNYMVEAIVTAGEYRKEYNYEFYCRKQGEFVSFEAINKKNEGIDDSSGLVGTVNVNKDSQYVLSGKQSAAIKVNASASGGFTWFSGARKYTNITGANTISFSMYIVEPQPKFNEARLKFFVETGVTPDVDYFRFTSELITIPCGQWTEVTLNLTGSDCNIADGICALYFTQYDPSNDWTWKSDMTMYMDEVCAKKVDVLNSISLKHKDYIANTPNFKVPVAKAKIGNVTATLMKKGETTGKVVEVGKEVTLERGCSYTITYKAEKLSSESDEQLTIKANVYCRDEGELISFEPNKGKFDGASPAYSRDMGIKFVNEPEHVKKGNYSVKIVFNGNYGITGFTWYTTNRLFTDVVNPAILKMSVYSEADTLIGFQLASGASGDQPYSGGVVFTKQVNKGWNEIVIDTTGTKVNLSHGLCELCFNHYNGKEGVYDWSALNLYVDNVRIESK